MLNETNLRLLSVVSDMSGAGDGIGPKRHSQLVACELEQSHGIPLTIRSIRSRLGHLKQLGFVSSYLDWIDGERIGKHWDITERGQNFINEALMKQSTTTCDVGSSSRAIS